MYILYCKKIEILNSFKDLFNNNYRQTAQTTQTAQTAQTYTAKMYITTQTERFDELKSNEKTLIYNCCNALHNSDHPEAQMKLAAVLLCEKGVY